MKALKARITKGLNHGSVVETCDNSGAKIVRVVSIKGSKTVRRRKPSCGISDLILVSVLKGQTEMRKQVVPAIVVRQKKEYRRKDGTRIKFADNAVIILKDEKGNPKGTMFKGPIAKEVAERWPAVAKVASIVV
ncbi:50S ribosomal protein L14 [Candidatus Woesearchaeota archaeon]|nr:50S ribosomal protein L14P [uncultured archaeon]MBS3171183.1 50S ribosomal protein L14 [Candidatus Woesearchaeota archaeon]